MSTLRYCVRCGDPFTRAKRLGSDYCGHPCWEKETDAIRASRKIYRFCTYCGHTEEMHDDAQRNPICMEPIGVNLESFCHCKAFQRKK